MNNYGGDSAVFILLGKMLNAGKTPYIEFFDHKGPTLIFVEAIGLRLSNNDRLSIFIFQIINLFITQILIYKIARTYLPQLVSISIVMLTLLAFSFTIQGGNSTEELSLSYLYLCLLITIRLDNYSNSVQKICVVVMGISASILFWMRLNNMGLICACLLFLIIIALKYKDRKRICTLILWAFIGFLFISIPIIIYFIHVGAFSEMMHACFTFNFKYIQYSFDDQPFSIMNFIKDWLSLGILMIGTILYYKRFKDYKMLILCIFLFLFALITTHIGPRYSHYMTLNLPLFTIGLIQIFSTQNNRLLSWKYNVIIFIITLFLLSGYALYKKNQDQYIKDQDDTIFIQNSTDIIKQVPADQRTLVFTYNVSPRFWLITNILPSYRFFTNQEWHGSHDKHIFIETNNLIVTKRPQWIILPNNNAHSKFLNIEFSNLLSKDYQEKYRNEDLILMQRIPAD